MQKDTAQQKNRFKRFVRKYKKTTRTLAAFLFLACVFGAFQGYLFVSGNFHEVIPGALYRAAQPNAQDIAIYEKMYGIKTIVNLRGENVGAPWYDEEARTTSKLGVKLINFRMSAKRILSQDSAGELIALLREAPRPILVHCNAGADRSGLAVALYLAAIAGKDENTAESQISLRFGHIGIPFLSNSFAMDTSFENLESWLGFIDS